MCSNPYIKYVYEYTFPKLVQKLPLLKCYLFSGKVFEKLHKGTEKGKICHLSTKQFRIVERDFRTFTLHP